MRSAELDFLITLLNVEPYQNLNIFIKKIYFKAFKKAKFDYILQK